MIPTRKISTPHHKHSTICCMMVLDERLARRQTSSNYTGLLGPVSTFHSSRSLENMSETGCRTALESPRRMLITHFQITKLRTPNPLSFKPLRHLNTQNLIDLVSSLNLAGCRDCLAHHPRSGLREPFRGAAWQHQSNIAGSICGSG